MAAKPLYVIVPDRDPLQDPLMFLAGGALIPLCKVALLDSFWGDPGPLFDTTRASVDRYFEYFETQCRLALYNWEKYDLSELRFRHVTEVAQMLKAGARRDEMEIYLSERLPGDCSVIASEIVDLTVRLLLMTPVWSFWQGVSPGETSLTWVEGTVGYALKRHFRGRGGSKSEEHLQIPGTEINRPIVLEKSFTAWGIEEVAGMRVVWTSNLLDHLKMRTEDNSVAIFHHASFLSYQRDNPLYPPGLIDETLRTLALLLPSTEHNTKEWFLRQHLDRHLDVEAVRCRPLNREERDIEKFDFWKERLVNLKMAFDRARPAKPNSLLKRCLSAIHIRS